MEKLGNTHSRQWGFSLVELLVVMVIMGLLASLVGPAMFGRVDSSKVRTATAQLQLLSTAITAYRLDTGRLPERLEQLVSFSDVRGWSGPYLQRELPLDPWGNNYEYKLDSARAATGFLLISYGADGKVGGEGIDADVEF